MSKADSRLISPKYSKTQVNNAGEHVRSKKLTEEDEKIIAIAKKDPFLNCYNDISEIPAQVSAEIMHFFEVYKQLEGKKTTIDKMMGRKEAEEIIQEAIDNYKKVFNK